MKLSWAKFAEYAGLLKTDKSERIKLLSYLTVSAVALSLGYWIFFINIPVMNGKAAADLEFEAFVRDLKEAHSTVKDIHKRVFEKNSISKDEAESIDREIKRASYKLIDSMFNQNMEISEQKEPFAGKERYLAKFIWQHQLNLEKFGSRDEFNEINVMLSEIEAKLENDCHYYLHVTFRDFLDGERFRNFRRH